MRIVLAIVASLLAGCANTPISTFTHADLQNAAKIAATPERAAVWRAVEAQVTSLEAANAAIGAQAKACAEAAKGALPSGQFGIATLIESAHNGRAAVDANCVPIPLTFP